MRGHSHRVDTSERRFYEGVPVVRRLTASFTGVAQEGHSPTIRAQYTTTGRTADQADASAAASRAGHHAVTSPAVDAKRDTLPGP